MTSSTPPSRLHFIEKAYALGIALVVLGHSLPRDHGQAYYYMYKWVISLIYTFHMPLFFIISGLLFRHTSSEAALLPSSGFIRGKAIRLLVPYICISSIAFPIKTALSAHALHPIDGSLSSYLHTLLYPWGNTIVFYWFLPTLFILFLFAPFMLSIAQNSSLLPKWLMTAALCALFFLFPNGTADWPQLLNWTGALHNALFFWSGIMVLPYTQKQYKPAMLVSTALLGLIAATCLFALFPAETTTYFVNAYTGSAAIFAIALLPWHKGRYTAHILAKNSYQIYLFSWFPQQVVVMLLERFYGAPILYMLCSFMLGITVPIILVSIIRRLDITGLYILSGMGSNRGGSKN